MATPAKTYTPYESLFKGAQDLQAQQDAQQQAMLQEGLRHNLGRHIKLDISGNPVMGDQNPFTNGFFLSPEERAANIEGRQAAMNLDRGQPLPAKAGAPVNFLPATQANGALDAALNTPVNTSVPTPDWLNVGSLPKPRPQTAAAPTPTSSPEPSAIELPVYRKAAGIYAGNIPPEAYQPNGFVGGMGTNHLPSATPVSPFDALAKSVETDQHNAGSPLGQGVAQIANVFADTAALTAKGYDVYQGAKSAAYKKVGEFAFGRDQTPEENARQAALQYIQDNPSQGGWTAEAVQRLIQKFMSGDTASLETPVYPGMPIGTQRN